MVFPTSNLPTASVPWGREVEKQLSAATITIKSNELNNAARDNQLAASLTRVNAAATKAQAAIDGLGNLDQATSTFKVNAANITVGVLSGITLTGNTINTAASGTRVQLAGTRADFYYGSDNVGYISGGTSNYSDNGIIISANASGKFLSVGPSWMGFQGGLNNWLAINGTQVQIGGTNGVSVTGTMSVSSISSLSTISSSFTTTGNLTVDGSIIRTALISTGTTGASITAGGALVRTSSSARYKQDIQDVEFNYQDILDLQPKKFRLKDDVSYNEDAPFHVGFVAEDLADTPLDIFVNYKEFDGQMLPDGVQYLGMTAMLLSAIKHQDSLIKDLYREIEILKGA